MRVPYCTCGAQRQTWLENHPDGDLATERLGPKRVCVCVLGLWVSVESLSVWDVFCVRGIVRLRAYLSSKTPKPLNP